MKDGERKRKRKRENERPRKRKRESKREKMRETLLRKLDCVAKEVYQHLPQSKGIPYDYRWAVWRYYRSQL